jgi:MYXO-CTERM domain-containing protein
MLRSLCGVAALAAVVGSASAQVTSATYDWEDGGTILGSFGGNMNAVNYVAGDPGLVHSGNASLFIYEEPLGGTPQAFVAWITGLQDGDVIDASFWAWDNTPDASPSVRIWGHYGVAADGIDSYEGSAGGNNTYSGATVWSNLAHSWTFDSAGGTRDSLIIEVRMYAGDLATNFAYIDDIAVTVTGADISGVNIIFPVPAPGAIALLGVAGLAGSRRRRG